MKRKRLRNSLVLAAVLLVAVPALALATTGPTVSPSHPSVTSKITVKYTTALSIRKGYVWHLDVTDLKKSRTCTYFAGYLFKGPIPAGTRLKITVKPSLGNHSKWCKSQKWYAVAATSTASGGQFKVRAAKQFPIG